MGGISGGILRTTAEISGQRRKFPECILWHDIPWFANPEIHISLQVQGVGVTTWVVSCLVKP